MDSSSSKKNLLAEFSVRGIDASRVFFAGRLPRPEYLSRYRMANLFLDTSPYNAGTTASDALWAGLPVLTFLGKTFSSRVCASLLTAIGLPEFICNSQKEYEELAITLGLDAIRYEFIKRRLSENRLTTLLFDNNAFTKSFEEALVQAYAMSVNGAPPENIFL